MNNLFPIFLKLDSLQTLVVGGGYVATEKVKAIYKNSPKAKVILIAPEISTDIKSLASSHKTLTLIEKPYDKSFLKGCQLVIVGTQINSLQKNVYQDAYKKGVLVNVADTPSICDFYLSSVVQKGDLKIAISTNGKSPSLAKRLREWLDNIIEEKDMQTALDNLYEIRSTLKKNFSEKVKILNNLTDVFKGNQK